MSQDQDVPRARRTSTWRTSTFCASATCVEVAATGDGVLIRDSKLQNSPLLAYSRAEFADFVKGVKAGEFDDLC